MTRDVVMSKLNIDDWFGNYRIVGLLDEGGMGRVYRATDHKLRRDVALNPEPLQPAGPESHP